MNVLGLVQGLMLVLISKGNTIIRWVTTPLHLGFSPFSYDPLFLGGLLSLYSPTDPILALHLGGYQLLPCPIGAPLKVEESLVSCIDIAQMSFPH